MKIKRLSRGLGAEVVGVDLSKPCSPSLIEEIRQAWYENLVLLFRDQELTPQRHVDFSRSFGELDPHDALPRYRHPDFPEIFQVTNLPIDGKPSETRNTGRQWHSDLTYTVRPALGSLLYSRQIPEVGGDTMFANMYMAYETLSPGLRKILDGLRAVHDIRGSRDLAKRGEDRLNELVKINPPVSQPVVLEHPGTGRRALFVNEMMTSHIAGWKRAESQALLRYLYDNSVVPEAVYRHRWQVNDLVMWDNRCTLHIALADYDHSSPRHMLRTTLLGERTGEIVPAKELEAAE